MFKFVTTKRLNCMIDTIADRDKKIADLERYSSALKAEAGTLMSNLVKEGTSSQFYEMDLMTEQQLSDALRMKVEELQAENEKLKEENSELQAENEKLKDVNSEYNSVEMRIGGEALDEITPIVRYRPETSERLQTMGIVGDVDTDMSTQLALMMMANEALGEILADYEPQITED